METVTTEQGNKLIAFRDKDSDGDVWSERAFLFHNEDDVKAFFVPDNPILLDIYCEDGERVLNDFDLYDGNPARRIAGCSFNTEYAGKVRISEMYGGYIINTQK